MLLGRGRRESTELVDRYIVQYCQDGAHKSSGNFPIRDVMDLTLQIILFCITQVAGSTDPHLSTRTHVNYAVLCRDVILYNWCAMLLATMKDQLTKCKMGRQRQFCYGLILASFFFERVPVTQPWGLCLHIV